ncbi:D-alanyl-D-alanine carboxypeptidase [Sphingobacterium chuzhouense]|uniref:D-alanyl-D-alanine carboxypeptidase n=1 Tax=Sphingobacterium chuzhouense TaxID=1742264 RepID=A0ABR7XQV7_9SPHI|nr:D-alanyl-D-alanine carboxypeptidase [Sphingobacterium chuzhouense]MBD1421267.1 D-alanyl-D-alanine carboxypeptidase [Sphingobacterium chuzhouense]
MNKFLFSVLVLFFCVYHGKSQDINLIQKELDQSPILKNHFFGFSLYDVDQNQFLMGSHEDKYFTPASNTKIFTLFTALKNIGDSIPAIYYIEKGDSLLFWGTGDPTFLHSKLDSGKVYNFLRATDRKLFYVGGTVTEEPFYRQGWAMEDYEEYYQPEITPFPIYGNVVTFGSIRNRLTVFPVRFQFGVATDETIAEPNRFRIHRKLEENTFLINSARIPNNYVNQKPFKYSDELIIQLLQDTLQKPVELIQYPKPAEVDTLFSVATKDVLREMMLVSDNFLAEQLMMVAAMDRYGEFNTARLRKDMEASYYAYFTDKIDLYDGSGLSPYNKVTARSLVELLLLVAQEVPKVEELRYLFAAGGLEGTLKTTYRPDGGSPFIWAKTGTIKSVYCQSGYIQTRSGRNLAFSFLNNNFIGSATPVRKEVSRIMTFIRENY